MEIKQTINLDTLALLRPNEQTVEWNPIEWKVKVFDTVSGKIVLERLEYNK